MSPAALLETRNCLKTQLGSASDAPWDQNHRPRCAEGWGVVETGGGADGAADLAFDKVSGKLACGGQGRHRRIRWSFGSLNRGCQGVCRRAQRQARGRSSVVRSHQASAGVTCAAHWGCRATDVRRCTCFSYRGGVINRPSDLWGENGRTDGQVGCKCRGAVLWLLDLRAMPRNGWLKTTRRRKSVSKACCRVGRMPLLAHPTFDYGCMVDDNYLGRSTTTILAG